ncbi:acyl-CoA dehydrogenase [Frankia canadensis]|uniref:acyl-CoA dehydrogenase n=1 Tax=Frankia canadensis TaxID=1836972 RepID=UPI001FAF7989|nr:acyl-CoA dehydrogenase [Frankia canadensis]
MRSEAGLGAGPNAGLGAEPNVGLGAGAGVGPRSEADAELRALREVVESFLERTSPPGRVRELMGTDPGYDPDAWRRMATEIGLQGLAVPVEYGGEGAGWRELAVVFETFGAALVCAPFFGTVALGVSALGAAADERAARRYLPRVAAGELVMTVALGEPQPAGEVGLAGGVGLAGEVGVGRGMTVAAERGPGGWTLRGECARVVDGQAADVVLVPASTPDGPGLFAVETAPSAMGGGGVERHPLPTLDQTRGQARLVLRDAPAQLVGQVGAAGKILARTAGFAAVALVAEQVGGAARCVREAAGYAGVRRQFGRLIGSFQAVKHACATMAVDVESARSLAREVTWLAATDDPRLPTAAALALAHCSDVYVRTAAANIQVHGGIGFTWEHPAHLYLKRAKSSAHLFGSPSAQRALAADGLAALARADGASGLSHALLADPAATADAVSAPPASAGVASAGVASAMEVASAAEVIRADEAVPAELAADLRARVARLLASAPDPAVDDGIPFRSAQFDAGLAWVGFPVGLGGLGLPAAGQGVIDDALAAAAVRSAHLRNPIGYGNAAPVLAAHGTDEQRRTYLRRCFTTEDIWCQMMSEPGAGSDVAGLATRARFDGKRWIVSGQKVWTSFAHVARFGLLVARTDPDVPKHQGISCFIVDMRAPGIEVRPLRMLTGKADFNEVFLNDVEVDDDNRIGEVNRGWAVVRSNLEGERLAFGRVGDEPEPWADLLEQWGARVSAQAPPAGRAAARDAVLDDQVMRAAARGWAARLTADRAQDGEPLHPAVVKILSSESAQEATEAALDLRGGDATLYAPDGYAFERPTHAGIMRGDAGERYLRTRALTIEGGTSMVMRNAVGEQVLGLPREHRVDVGIPWRDIPR